MDYITGEEASRNLLANVGASQHNNANDTNTESKEIDEKIDNEFRRGFHRIQAET